MDDLCGILRRRIKDDTSKLAAMDIGCVYHSYMFSIKTSYQQKVASYI